MKILVVGGTGTVGSAVVKELELNHEVWTAGGAGADFQVDFTSPDSIRAMYEAVGKVDAVISTAGSNFFGPLSELTPEKNELAIMSKLKGQINLVLLGMDYVNDGGSFTLTTGVVIDDPIRGGASGAMASGAIRGFIKSAAYEMPRGIRINDVSPQVLIESMDIYGPFFPGFEPIPASKAALAYRKSVEGVQTGQTFKLY